MSGYKRATVTISEEEYRRLHQADIKRRFKEHRKKDKTPEQITELTKTLSAMEDRHHEFEQVLSGLSQEFDWMGAEIVHEVLAQNAASYENMVSLVRETALEADAALDLLSRRFLDEIQREREHYALHVHSLIQRIDVYEQKERSKAEVARRWLKQAVSLADSIQAQYEHERFLPGQLLRIQGTLSLAQDNLRQGFLEASVHTSQQAFLQLSELRFELEHRAVEWQTEYERAHNALTRLVDELESNSSVNAIGLEGEELAVQVDLTYWSDGTYQELADKCRQLRAILTQEKRSISTEELKRTANELPVVIREKFESIIYEARLKALSSQLRMNIAERALQALEVQGFTLLDAGYSHRDMRAAFTANLENPDGSRVVIEVLPIDKTKQELASELVVTTSHPYLKTEQETRLQWQELCRSLNEYDLQVSQPEIRTAPPLPAAAPAEQPSLPQGALRELKKYHDVQ